MRFEEQRKYKTDTKQKIHREGEEKLVGGENQKLKSEICVHAEGCKEQWWALFRERARQVLTRGLGTNWHSQWEVGLQGWWATWKKRREEGETAREKVCNYDAIINLQPENKAYGDMSKQLWMMSICAEYLAVWLNFALWPGWLGQSIKGSWSSLVLQTFRGKKNLILCSLTDR